MDKTLDLDELERVAREATPGPWAHMQGRGLVRAIRDDLAIPLFEVLEPYGDPLEASPTVRVGQEVLHRAKSQGAQVSAALKRQHANGAFAATFDPPTILTLIAAARPAETRDWSEFEDEISDAISDSIDMDWSSRDGARAVVALLNKEAPR